MGDREGEIEILRVVRRRHTKGEEDGEVILFRK
jgi:hypothetical protein